MFKSPPQRTEPEAKETETPRRREEETRIEGAKRSPIKCVGEEFFFFSLLQHILSVLAKRPRYADLFRIVLGFESPSPQAQFPECAIASPMYSRLVSFRSVVHLASASAWTRPRGGGRASLWVKKKESERERESGRPLAGGEGSSSSSSSSLCVFVSLFLSLSLCVCVSISLLLCALDDNFFFFSCLVILCVCVKR